MDVSPNAFDSHRSADMPLPVGEPLILARRDDAAFEFATNRCAATPRSTRALERSKTRERERDKFPGPLARATGDRTRADACADARARGRDAGAATDRSTARPRSSPESRVLSPDSRMTHPTHTAVRHDIGRTGRTETPKEASRAKPGRARARDAPERGLSARSARRDARHVRRDAERASRPRARATVVRARAISRGGRGTVTRARRARDLVDEAFGTIARAGRANANATRRSIDGLTTGGRA